MEKRYRQYFEAAPCYFTVQDRSLRIIDANRQFEDDFGPVQGRYCYEVYKGRSEPCEACPVEETFRDGEPRRSQERVRCIDGREVPVIVYTSPIRDEHGEINAVLELSADISGIKRLQRALSETRERYQMLFEKVPCYITVQNPDHRMIEVNRLTREVFGEAEGEFCYRFFKGREQECPTCPVRDTMRDGEIHESEEILVSKDDEPIHVLVQAAPIRDEEGRIVQVMEMATDITSIRQLQSQLESVGLLISSVSHGIKGLLTGLDGGKYLVTSGLERHDPKRVKKGWEMVERNIDQVRGMVLNILYYAKERELDREEVDPKRLIAEACETVRSRAAAHHVALVQTPEAGAGTVQADPTALSSLLVNLLENAVDACRVDRKKAAHRVTISASGRPDHVRFEVEDNGIGMDSETRSRAFSLFFSSKGAEGTGLGLFVANKIAKAHGGRIRLESEPDRGTRFIVMIPRGSNGPSDSRKEPTDG